jgi:deoxyribose-phosphate aldolase
MSDQDLDRIADIVASRIRAQIGGAAAPTAARAASAAPARQAGSVDHQLAKMIDHTLLKPEVTRDELRQLCDEARQYGFASVCVNSSNVATCVELLRGADVMVCAVVGFPLGAMAPHAKAFETREAVRAGASEIDMVINIGALREADYALVVDDIRKVVTAARPARVKVILETSKLTDEQKVAGCTLSKLAGAHFVKTSTGFGGGGATPEDVALMRRVVGPELGVKASGAVRCAEDAAAVIAAGANRIGASASITIVTGGRSSGDY